MIFSGWAPDGSVSEAEQMREAWRGPELELVVEPTATITAENAARTLPLLRERGIERALVVCTPLHLYRARYFFRRLYAANGIEARFRAAPVAPTLHALAWELVALTARSRQLHAAEAELEPPRLSDTLVFIPAWNEEQNLPAVLDALPRGLPEADVLVVDDGSTDRTADVARGHGAEVLSLGGNRGLRIGIAAGYRYALDHGYAFCGRVDATGSIRSRSSRACSRSCARTAATSPSAPASSAATATRRTATGRARPGGSAPASSAGR